MRMTAIVLSSISAFLCEIMVNIYTISGKFGTELYCGEIGWERRIPACGSFPTGFRMLLRPFEELHAVRKLSSCL